MTGSALLINADARRIPLASESIQCVVTSPPYWALRDYGVDGQIGRESSPAGYVDSLVRVFREVRRVLRDDGVLWLNLGDTYAGSGGAGGDYGDGGRKAGQPRYRGSAALTRSKRTKRGPGSGRWGGGDTAAPGLRPKNLIGIPWRVALALQSDGWWLRSEIIWHKPNAFPESVRDRPQRAHEHIFMLTKSAKYFYDASAIMEPAAGNATGKAATFAPRGEQGMQPGNTAQKRIGREKAYAGATRNRRSVWTISTSRYRGAHFATFPEKLVEPMILAGSRPGDVVLDPFAGTATVGAVALKYHRYFVGLELNADYITLAEQRLSHVQPTLI